jgi:hypothetical protein
MSCHSPKAGIQRANLNEADFVRVWNTNDTRKVASEEEFETFI